MSPQAKTHLNRGYDHFPHVVHIMARVIQGQSPEEIRRHIVEEDPFGASSREYRGHIANWLISDFVRGFAEDALKVFARVMTSDGIQTQIKRELLFWKTCQRDRLAREITIGPVFQAYFRGDPFILKDDIIQTVMQKIGLQKPTALRSTDGYLHIATKLGFLNYGESRLDLQFYRPHQKSVLAILSFLIHSGLSPAKLLQAQDFQYLLLDERDLISCLADLGSAGLIDFAMAGNIVRLEPTFRFEELPHVLEG